VDRSFGWAYRIANALHVRTKRSFIQRELLFGVGDCYDPFLLSETERLLRGYGFLGQVDVFAVAQPDSTYHVVINTRDVWSTHVDMRLGFDHGLELEGFRIRESNLLGTGQEIGVFYFHRQVTRDYGVSYSTPQLLGTRWDLRGSVGRTRAGTFVGQTVAYPFLGDVSHWAALQSFSRDDQFFDYLDPDSASEFRHLLLPVRKKFVDVVVGTRFGKPGNLTSLGALVGYQQMRYLSDLQLAKENDFDKRVRADSADRAEVAQQAHPLTALRVGAVFGQRNVSWVKRRGLDVFRGQQDVPLGTDLVLTLSKSVPSLEPDNDLTGTLKLYGSREVGPALFASRMRFDVRRDFAAAAATSAWRDFYADAELMTYYRAPAQQTLFLRGALAGAWNTYTPFQLTLGGDRNLRGYRYERFPGGRRVIFNAEDRINFGWPAPDAIDLGGTLFVDVGRIWPGDVPFGVDSGWRSTGGVGLRGSFPAGSRSSFRIDLATPLDGSESFKKFRFVISATELLGLSGSDVPDYQVLRSRSEGVSGRLFRFRSQ
jgi:hypothetical protein